MRLVFCLFILLCSAPALIAQDVPELEFTELLSGLNDARSIYASSAGNLFIAETGNNRVLKVSAEGVRLDSLGRLGAADYQFDQPLDVDATNELKIYVSDYNNRRIQVFDRRFQYLSTVELPRRLQREYNYSPTRLSVNHLGQLFFYDEESRHIYKYDANGRYEQRFDTRGEDRIFAPSALVSTGDVLFIADSRRNLIHRMNANGAYLGFIATASRPEGLSVFDNRIYSIAGQELLAYNSRGQLIDSQPFMGIRGVRGLAVFRNQLFLLTTDKVYMAIINR